MDFTNLKNYLDNLVKSGNCPGCDCMVYKNHEPVFRYMTGYSDIESGKKINGDELYLIFSMTKMLTCTAALQLFERGKFSLDDEISDYLPEFSHMKICREEAVEDNTEKIITGTSFGENAEIVSTGYAETPITVKHLFTMSAGFDYDLGDPAMKKALEQGKKTTRELACAMADKTLHFEPGTRFRYSLCHDVLGALVEVWSGMSLGEYMKKNIFEPVGMKNTFFGVPKDAERLLRMATRYTRGKNGGFEKLPLVCSYNFTQAYESGGAGLCSCTQDYALFLDALACNGKTKDGREILKKQTIELMRTNHLTAKQLDDFHNIIPGHGYGLGVRTHMNPAESETASPVGEFGWDGAAGGFSSVDTENGISLALFQHFHSWHAPSLRKDIRNALYSCLD